MTDNEIIKALEYTIHRIKGANELIVPKMGVENLCNGLEKALDLINRQKAEKEELTEQLNFLEQEYKKLYEKNKKLLLKLSEKTGKASRIVEKIISSKARKEFAERLKKKSEHFELEKENFVSEADIDRTLAEMESERE